MGRRVWGTLGQARTGLCGSRGSAGPGHQLHFLSHSWAQAPHQVCGSAAPICCCLFLSTQVSLRRLGIAFSCHSQRWALPFLARHLWAWLSALVRREAISMEDEVQTQRQGFPGRGSARQSTEWGYPARPLLPHAAVGKLWEGRCCHSPRGMSLWLGNHVFFLEVPRCPSAELLPLPGWGLFALG